MGINFNPGQIGNIDPNSKNSKNGTSENETSSSSDTSATSSTSIDPNTVMNFLAAGSSYTFKQAPSINVSNYVDSDSKSRIASSMQSFESLHSNIISGLNDNSTTTALSSADKNKLALQIINNNFMPSNS